MEMIIDDGVYSNSAVTVNHVQVGRNHTRDTN